MAPKEEDRVSEANERPDESHGDSAEAKLARTGQEKPQDLVDKLQQREDLRKKGLTASSRMLPGLDFSGEDLSKLIEKAAKTLRPEELAPGFSPKGKPSQSPAELDPGFRPKGGSSHREDLDPGFVPKDKAPPPPEDPITGLDPVPDFPPSRPEDLDPGFSLPDKGGVRPQDLDPGFSLPDKGGARPQ